MSNVLLSLPLTCMLAFAAAPLLPGHARAQVIPDAPACARCTIDMRAVVRIGTADGPGSLPGRPVSVQPDGKGRYWVSALDYPRPLIYGADGRFIQEFGKDGDGPGEYRRAYFAAALPGDSVLISVAQRRAFVVVGPDLQERRTIAGTGLLRPRIVHWPDRVASQQSTYEGLVSKHTISLFDMSGPQLREVKRMLTMETGGGTKDREAAARLYSESLRSMANPVGDHVWIAQYARYKLVRYGVGGAAQDSLVRSPSWFRDLAVQRIGSETTLPTPHLAHIAEDAQGRLWVFLAQPRTDASNAWRDAKVKMLKAPGGAQEGRVSDMPADYTQFRTVIEVIDPKSRRLVARKTVDGYVSHVISSNRVVTFVENEDGIPVATIWELTLRGG